MVQEEQQKCSNSSSGGGGGGGSGGGRSLKKVKQKKIPQRGLGVAQLEKIRLEEQNKKDHQSSSSSFPFPTPLTDLSPSSTQYRPNSSIPPSNFDPFSPPPPPSLPLPLPRTTFYGQNSSNPQTGGGYAIGGSTETMSGHGYFPSMWNPCELNYDVEGPKLDPGFAFPPHLQNESNPFSPPPVMIQRKQPPPPPPYYSKVNVSSSSGLNLQMEPPSNQSYYSNYPPHLWPEEEKMIGMKRPWPFSLDGPLGSSNHCKFPPFVPPIYRLNESSSCRNGTSFNFEQGNTILGEGPSGSSALHVGWRGEMNRMKGYKENGEPDTLLTLAPPATTSSSKSSKAKQPIEFPASHYQEFSDFNMLPYQGYTEDPIFRTGGSVQQQPFYSFFPTNGQQIGHLTATSNDRRGETGNGVDLNLKL